MAKLLIGLTSYNDLHYLREVLPQLAKMQDALQATVVVMDNAHSDEVRDFVKTEFPAFEYTRHEEGNIGYGRSYSEILKAHPGHDLFLVCTNDVLMDPEVTVDLVERVAADGSIAMAAGKLHHWDFEAKVKTDHIDSLGICAQRRHHFYDRGHGEEDRGQYDEVLNEVLGISGAVFVIRTAVIPKLHGNEWQIFDENMWMYKEDIDLAYRLRELGERIAIFPEVWAWHARTVANKEGQGMAALARADAGKRDYGRQHSYRNHLLLLKNHLTWRYGLGVWLRVLLYESMKGLYMLLRHPAVFLAGVKALLFVKANRGARLVSPKAVLSHFE